ncbi:MAG: tetratricopeptide repeat protein [Deltaproteobacteria bacterium]|nr:tetratricopeptide repeat protein [Deltaproteobacteria bacterium]
MNLWGQKPRKGHIAKDAAMTMGRRIRRWTGLGILSVAIALTVFVCFGIGATVPAPVSPAILYPPDKAVFPRDIAAPTFRWSSAKGRPDRWEVFVGKPGTAGFISTSTTTPAWRPSEMQWTSIQKLSLEQDVAVTVRLTGEAGEKSPAFATRVMIRTSRDAVGAPLFYREVNLPFVEAVKDPSRIRWRFGAVSSRQQPPVVLEKLPVCGNCHSFSSDGSVLGMDVDYASDKGSYAVAQVTEEIVLDKEKIITWSDYKREDQELTFGLLSQVSPDGRYLVSTVKDRSVFVPKPDLAYSQLFFPVQGILVVYDRRTKTFRSLPGACNPQFVQSNPCWSPDGKWIVFARSQAHRLKNVGDKILLTQEECREFLKDGKTFLFDLYRVPFNHGKGGKAEPIPGASHNGMSNYFARYSPDGKWIVFCKSKSFMLLQPDSQLYIMPSAGGTPRRLRCNTSNMNSWHSWSPNGKWLVFASKIYGPYTQLLLTHMDDAGRSSPPVVLDHFISPGRAANIPEFVAAAPNAIRRIRERFLDEFSFLRAGQEFIKAKDLEGAEKMYRMALEANPKSAEAHNSLGIVLMGKRDLLLAENHFEQAIQYQPDHAKAYCNMGILMMMKGKYPEAQGSLEKAIVLQPEYAKAHYNLGVLMITKRDYPMAEACFEKAVKYQPDHAKAQRNLNALRARKK